MNIQKAWNYEQRVTDMRDIHPGDTDLGELCSSLSVKYLQWELSHSWNTLQVRKQWPWMDPGKHTV